eukprot:Skav222402  [mRNA]  locus=scaffold4422:371543:380320:+ [translate_table: standard]
MLDGDLYGIPCWWRQPWSKSSVRLRGGGINSGNSDDWNRCLAITGQESGSSSSSLGSELKARDHLSPALLSSQLAALAANTAAPWYGLGGLPAVPPEVPPEQSYMVSLSHSDLQESGGQAGCDTP